MPATTAKAIVPAKLSTSAIPTNATTRTTSATMAQRLRDQRSAAAPNSGPRSIAGIRSAIRTRLIAHGDSKRCSAISSSAM